MFCSLWELTFPYTNACLSKYGAICLSTGHLTSFLASTKNVFLQSGVTIQNIVEALKWNRKGPLPEWTLSMSEKSFCHACHEKLWQFKSAIHSTNLTDYEELTYLKTFVASKAEFAMADVAYGQFHGDNLKTLERKFGLTQVAFSCVSQFNPCQNT